MPRRFACLLLLSLAAAALHAQPQPGPGTVLSQVRTDDGQTLAVWSRVPAQPRGTIVLVHGRTWSALPNFDLQVPGEPRDARSVLAALAQAGFAAYAVDLRGYGGSPRDRTGWNTPARAVADVRSVLAWVAQTHPDVPPPALLGYSNGARVRCCSRSSNRKRFPHWCCSASRTMWIHHPRQRFRRIGPCAHPPRPLRPARISSPPTRHHRAYVRLTSPRRWQRTRCAPTGARWSSSPSTPSRSQTLPVLLLRGVDDPIATQADNAHLYARLRSEDRSWVTLPHADHVAQVEDSHAAGWTRW